VEVPDERQLDVREWTRAQLGAEGLAAIAASGIPHADSLTAQWQPRDP